MPGCPFCDLIQSGSGDVLRAGLAAAFLDKYPVSEGHMLVVPIRHEADFTLLTSGEHAAIWALVSEVIASAKLRRSPAGFNIGVNVGEAAGQTVGHAHMHVIPRYSGDVDDPRGGVRWVVPTKAVYW